MAGEYDLTLESIESFVKDIKNQIKDTCYIAIVDYGDTWEIEVEVSSGTIAGNFTVNGSLAAARDVADKVADVIYEKTGCYVCDTREEWEETFSEE